MTNSNLFKEDIAAASDDEFKPVQRDTELPGCVESVDMTDELESALSQATEIVEEEPKKTKKNKKKKNAEATPVDSSADDFKEVEAKPKKKKNKKQDKQQEEEKKEIVVEPEPIVYVSDTTPEILEKEMTPEIVKETTPQPVPRRSRMEKQEVEAEMFEPFETSNKAAEDTFEAIETPKEETASEIFEEFSKRTPPSKIAHSPDRDLVEFSEEESSRIVEVDDDNDDSEKVEFFIKEKSSSVEPDESSSSIDPLAARPNPWLENFLKKSSSMIEDHIFGAVKKYENDDKLSDDEGMEELEKNHADIEKNIADLLEDEDELISTTPPPPQPPVTESLVDKISSNLSQLLKGESSGKKTLIDDSSDDDFLFRPVPQQKKNKKQKKQKGQVLSLEEFHRATSSSREQDSGSVADSESEKVSDQEVVVTTEESKDGWSFEIDEEDVNKLLEASPTEGEPSEERTDLEDVFRFDSEMREEQEEEEERKIGEHVTKSLSVDDLNDALMEETTDESEAEASASVPESKEEENGLACSSVGETIKPVCGTSMSSSYASSVDSESSTTNSPNPRNAQNKNKNKKGKKKKK